MSTAVTNGSPNGATTETAPQPSIKLQPLAVAKMEVPIVGLSPLIPHRWSQKALRLMREKQSGNTARPKHEPKVPEDEAEGSCYYLPDGCTPGMPATAFKAAVVDGCRFFQGLPMTQARTCFFIEGIGPDQLVEITEYERVIREDTPRNATGVADLRYRYAYYPWRAILPVTFIPSVVDQESVLALVNAAGLGGVGDWRPSAPKSKTGTFGRFEVDTEREIRIS